MFKILFSDQDSGCPVIAIYIRMSKFILQAATLFQNQTESERIKNGIKFSVQQLQIFFV